MADVIQKPLETRIAIYIPDMQPHWLNFIMNLLMWMHFLFSANSKKDIEHNSFALMDLFRLNFFFILFFFI